MKNKALWLQVSGFPVLNPELHRCIHAVPGSHGRDRLPDGGQDSSKTYNRRISAEPVSLAVRPTPRRKREEEAGTHGLDVVGLNGGPLEDMPTQNL